LKYLLIVLLIKRLTEVQIFGDEGLLSARTFDRFSWGSWETLSGWIRTKTYYMILGLIKR